jgi:hypothetical protein
MRHLAITGIETAAMISRIFLGEAIGANLRRHALECHDGHSAGSFGDDRLLFIRHVHNYAAFEHFGEAGLEAKAGGRVSVIRHYSSRSSDDGLAKAARPWGTRNDLR